LALEVGLGEIEAPEFDERIKRIIGNRHQMRGRAGGHSLSDRAAVDHHHVFAAAAQLVSRGQARNAGPDHDHIRSFIAAQGRGVWRHLHIHP
jgi:hypothetical protein